VTSSIHFVATIALGLHRDGRSGRFGVLALHAGRTPSGVEHFEQPFLHGFGPCVSGAGCHPLAQVRRCGLNVGALPSHIRHFTSRRHEEPEEHE
jgi:hypothetical protein